MYYKYLMAKQDYSWKKMAQLSITIEFSIWLLRCNASVLTVTNNTWLNQNFFVSLRILLNRKKMKDASNQEFNGKHYMYLSTLCHVLCDSIQQTEKEDSHK